MQQVAKIVSISGNELIPSRLTKGLQLCKESEADAFCNFKRFMEYPDETRFDSFTAVDLSTALLKNIKKQTPELANCANVVITVPARFSDVARKATKIAAQQAGLNVIRLLNEPTAAALAYGRSAIHDGLYVIYDFGGGTFDVTVLRIENQVFQVLGTTGDLDLGGNNIDRDIAAFSGCSLSDARVMKELFNNRKIVSGIKSEDLCNIQISINQHVARTLRITRQILVDLQLKENDISGVVLVGGSTRLARVVDGLTEIFGQSKILNTIDPDRTVALGAALHCEALSGHAQTSRPLLLDIVPSSLGIQTIGGYVENIIPKYTPTPIHVNMRFSTMCENQTEILIHVVQGDSMMAEDCTSLGKFILKGVKPMRKGVPQIDLSFGVDEDGVLTVQVNEKISGVQQLVVIEPYAR
jgi:molecular chaperone HscA